MTIKELDDKLNSPGFQNPEDGDLFYNFFIYQYPADKEYDIRRQIQEFKANRIRPINYLDVLTLNLFDEFCNFLDQKKYLRHPSMLKYQLKRPMKLCTGWSCYTKQSSSHKRCMTAYILNVWSFSNCSHPSSKPPSQIIIYNV